MEFLTILPKIGVLSWIIMSAFVIVNGLLFLWMYRNWQESEKVKPELSEKEKQYNDFLDLTGFPIEKERLVYLHSEVIRACFNIWMKGVVTFEDWLNILNFIYSVENANEFRKIPAIVFDNFRVCQKLVKYHRNNKMIFPADKFFQVFFGFGQYYEQVLNDNKK